MDISIIIPTLNEKGNIRILVPEIKEVISGLIKEYEIIVVDGGSTDGTQEVVLEQGINLVRQRIKGYGRALKEGFEKTKGQYILTMDSDCSHKPLYIKDLWDNRDTAELIIASRYINGGKAEMPLFRRILSVVLNRFYTRVLQIPYKDISSGFRMYNRKIFDEIKLVSNGFALLEELLVKVHCNGWRIKEIPFEYSPRKEGRSNVKLFKFACSYIATLISMWRLRNSLLAADYDYRAYYSRILPQRFWQRKRYETIMGFLDNRNAILDIGCGSSKIIKDLPLAVGMDVNHRTLRYLKNNGCNVVEADIENIPFKGLTFKTIICSEVIEHLPIEKFRLDELERVIAEGGVLILGTPDYNKKSWHFVEWVYGKVMPWGYADQHKTHYTFRMLKDMLEKRGWKISDCKYVYGMEMIIKATSCFISKCYPGCKDKTRRGVT